MKALSDGGGADSFAMLLDALDRGERPDEVVFADVGSARGDDGEWPDTYRHLRDYTIPLCRREEIPFVWITTEDYPIRGHESLLAYFEATRTMPTRMSRMCSAIAKIERVERYLRDHFPGEPVEMWIGFEAGEEARLFRDPHAGRPTPGRTNRFPLVEAGLCRCRAAALIRRHGYPVPRKSACVFCPFSTKADFRTLAREIPATFARVAGLEANAKPTRSGKILRYGYRKGDGSDPSLAEWIARPYTPKPIPCAVCGADLRADKSVGCGYAA